MKPAALLVLGAVIVAACAGGQPAVSVAPSVGSPSPAVSSGVPSASPTGAGSAGAPTSAPVSASAPDPSTTQASSPTVVTASGESLPAELRGTWRGRRGSEVVTLTLRDRRYQIGRSGDSVAGGLAVNGAVLEFTASSACSG